MTAVPKSRFDASRAIARPALTPICAAAYKVCEEFAKAGKQITQYDICEAIGSENWNGGTMAGVLNKLERDGWITRTFYQRGLQVCLPDGTCTAPPPNQTPHWRKREQPTPTPTIQAVRQKSQSIAQEIEAEARRLNRALADHLMDLVHIGHAVQSQSKGVWGDA